MKEFLENLLYSENFAYNHVVKYDNKEGGSMTSAKEYMTSCARQRLGRRLKIFSAGPVFEKHLVLRNILAYRY